MTTKSKEYLADMLKSLASGDVEGAKAHFSKVASEKSIAILSGEKAEDQVEPTPAPEPEPAPPADDTTKPE